MNIFLLRSIWYFESSLEKFIRKLFLYVIRIHSQSEMTIFQHKMRVLFWYFHVSEWCDPRKWYNNLEWKFWLEDFFLHEGVAGATHFFGTHDAFSTSSRLIPFHSNVWEPDIWKNSRGWIRKNHVGQMLNFMKGKS